MTQVETVQTNIGQYDADRLVEAFHNVEVADKYANPEHYLIKEGDPDGIDQHAPGAKLDQGKPDVGLLFESFPNALLAVSEVATFGAAKYSRGGWKEVQGALIRYAAAEGRHKLYRYQGEVNDKESKFTHRAHEAWNVLAQLELVLTGRETQ